MKTRLKVLVIAEAANPEWVSVPLIGWSLSQALGRLCDVHIVTQLRNKEAFERAGLIEGQDFTAIDSEKLAAPMWKLGQALRLGEGKGWTMMQAVSALSYPYFERQVWKQFGAALRAGDFDIVHRVTPLSPTTGSPIARRCFKAKVPFVMGPLNGGVPWPKGFDSERRREKEWLSYVRGIYKFLPNWRATMKSAAAIITGSRHTQGEVPDVFSDKTVYIPENAIDPERFSTAGGPPAGPLQLCFVGRMVPYKGPDMLLEATAELVRSGKVEIDMVGDGPLLEGLESFAAEQGLSAGVRFHGWMAHEEVQTVLGRSHLLAFPSVREFGGGVVLEAMALGAVPMVVDYAGPGELVTPEVGFALPIGTRDEIIAEFAKALDALAHDRASLSGMSQAAKARVADKFTWERKAEQIVEVYRWVLGQGGKPAPFEPPVN